MASLSFLLPTSLGLDLRSSQGKPGCGLIPQTRKAGIQLPDVFQSYPKHLPYRQIWKLDLELVTKSGNGIKNCSPNLAMAHGISRQIWIILSPDYPVQDSGIKL
ncbi:hypothetical protein TNCV_3938601 [Trichonephila clavipes]|nr:hypothetical protein TNCV_3938601 [Trichonephila clavipes]